MKAFQKVYFLFVTYLEHKGNECKGHKKVKDM